MRRLLVASVGILALGVASASAASLVRPKHKLTKAPVYVPPIWSWTGAYIGVNGGGGWGHSDFSVPFPTGSFSSSGGLVGGTLGYNYQVDNNIVLGLEGDMDWADFRGSASCAATSCETRSNWLATVRGRIGYAFGIFMPYATGGLAVGDIENSIAGVGSASDTKAGWTAGGGIEAHISGPWTAKLEYLYVDLGRGASIAGSDANFQSNIVRVGLNYRF